MPDDVFLAQFLAGYMRAAEWSSHWRADAKAEAARICRQFCTENEADILEAERRGRPADCLGHDLWLTGAGHGTGFRDRDELKADGLGERLTEACKRAPYRDRSIDCYRGAIYFL